MSAMRFLLRFLINIFLFYCLSSIGMKVFRIVYRIGWECFSKANDTIKYQKIFFSSKICYF